jgi:hypothetical protein
MTPVKDILAPYQIDIEGYIESAKRRSKEECHHCFVRFPIVDHENDRILKIRVCQKCGYEEP